jgi:hypothetical protein
MERREGAGDIAGWELFEELLVIRGEFGSGGGRPLDPHPIHSKAVSNCEFYLKIVSGIGTD